MRRLFLEKFAQNLGVRKYAINTASLFAESFLRLTVGFVVALWVVRYLGPEQFGMLSYAQAFAAILISFASLGLDAVVVRELHRESSDRDAVLGTVFGLKFLASIVAFILIVSSALTIEGPGRQFHLIAVAGSPVLFSAFSTIEYYFQSEVKSHFIAIAKSVSLLATSGLRIFLIQIDADLIFFAYVFLFDAAMVALCLGFTFQKFGASLLNWRIDFALVRSFMKSALYLSLNSAMVLMFWNVDKLMLRYLIADFEVIGIYSAAVRLYEILAFIPVILCASFFPAILSAKQNPASYKARLQSLADVLFLVAVVLTGLGILFSDQIILLALGEEFLPASKIFSIAMLGNIFVFLGVVGSRFLLSENLEHVLLVRTIIGLACNIVLNYVLIQHYGVIGAAISTVISSFVVAILADLASFKKTREIFIIKIKSVVGITRCNKWLGS